MPRNTEHYKKVKQAEIELDKRIKATNLQKNDESYRGFLDGLRYISILFLLGWIIFTGNLDFSVMLIVLFFVLPILCKIYSIIVASFTIFSGIKIAFSGQFVAFIPVLPFTVLNPEVSCFCLGWGFLAVSRSTRSKFSCLVAIIYLVRGVLGLFQGRVWIEVTDILGSMMGGILIIWFGLLMTLEILLSWEPAKFAE